MENYPIVKRHYYKIDKLVMRSAGDSEAELEPFPTELSTLLLEFREAMPEKPRLVSSIHGAIKDILFTIPEYAVVPPLPGQKNSFTEAFIDLFKKLPNNCRTIVVTHKSVEDNIVQWLKDANLEEKAIIIPVPNHLHFSTWAEDGCVVTQDQKTSNAYLLTPYKFLRRADDILPSFLNNATPYLLNKAPLYFQGGNILVGDNFFLVGGDYPMKSLTYINDVILPQESESPEETVRRLYREYMDSTREIIYVESKVPVPWQSRRSINVDGDDWTETFYRGNSEGTVQPIFHIDMFITLAGRDRSGRYQILVGDPSMAAAELNVPLWPYSMAEVFNDIAKSLELKGFKIIRNPLPLVYFDEEVQTSRIWYFASSNNALVQIIQEDNKTVWLPTYGHGHYEYLNKTDETNKLIWESLGFKVIMLSDFHHFAERLGAVHCIKKYLKRN